MIQTPTNNFISEDEIDFRHLAAVFKRRWVWIATCTIAGALTSSVLTVMSKQVWAGEFQIVVSDAQQGGVGALSSLLSSNPMLASIAGTQIGGGETGLQTELKILEPFGTTTSLRVRKNRETAQWRGCCATTLWRMDQKLPNL